MLRCLVLGRGTQLPYYSEIDEIKKILAFSLTMGDGGQGRPPQVELSSETLFVTHVSNTTPIDRGSRSKDLDFQVSAQGDNFFAYSHSMVLWGVSWDDPSDSPTIIPELQGRSVISVVVGKDHFGALTSSGELLTWGKYSKGALGLEDPSIGESPRDNTGRERAYIPPEVTVPTEVRFDHREQLEGEGRVKKYCFAVAACGNHTAALVVDLAGDEVPPEDSKQNALRSVGSSLVCNDS